MRPKRMIGGRLALRCVLYQASIMASTHDPDLEIFADRLRKDGKPHKVVAAVARNLVVIANALCKSRELCAVKTGCRAIGTEPRPRRQGHAGPATAVSRWAKFV